MPHRNCVHFYNLFHVSLESGNVDEAFDVNLHPGVTFPSSGVCLVVRQPLKLSLELPGGLVPRKQHLHICQFDLSLNTAFISVLPIENLSLINFGVLNHLEYWSHAVCELSLPLFCRPTLDSAPALSGLDVRVYSTFVQFSPCL